MPSAGVNCCLALPTMSKPVQYRGASGHSPFEVWRPSPGTTGVDRG